MSFVRLATRSGAFPHYALAFHPQNRLARFSAAALSRDVIEKRVLDVLKTFEKINPLNLTTKSSFTRDMGLDSLDTVEVVMAVEEEFSIEIPDTEADAIQTVEQAIDYIAKTPEAH